MTSTPSESTNAAVVGPFLRAGTFILTWFASTEIDGVLTVVPCVHLRTGADVASRNVMAGAPILARFWFAKCHLILTLATCEFLRAQTGKGGDAIHAGASIKTGTIGAVLSIDLTIYPLVASGTITLVRAG